MQIYKGMDIITSKPGLSLQRKVPHHLIDMVNPYREYNVASYRRAALKKIKEIIKRGKNVIFSGGTGLYVSILVDGIFESGPQDERVRARLYSEAKRYGGLKLFKRLKKVDPEAALKIHPNDTKRVIRALEVYENCGKPISQLQKERKGLCGAYEVLMFSLNMKRDELYARINRRVDKMFFSGAIPEVKALLKQKLSRTASFAIGLKELNGYFKGEYPLEAAKELMKKNTRNYAKRQMTWFRKDKRIVWVEVGKNEKPREIANRIKQLI